MASQDVTKATVWKVIALKILRIPIKLFVATLIFVVLIVACLIFYAMNAGIRITIPGLKIEPLVNADRQASQVHVDSILQAICLTRAELSNLFPVQHPIPSNRDSIVLALRRAFDNSAQLESLEDNFYFQLLRLEMTIPKYGTQIDTRIVGESRREVYRRIQTVLKGLGVFDGEIDGDQATTLSTLIRFQSDLINRDGTKTIDTRHYGYFGYRTLEAIRSAYRRMERVGY